MSASTIVKVVMQKGWKNTNLSMFLQEERREILEEVCRIYLRQGKMHEMMEVLKEVDLKSFSDIMKKIADNCLDLNDYENAVLIYEKIGEKEIAEVIRKNFLI